ncbi:WXG100 family type VII secretion target [Anaerosporobacter faecicola]|uniref:WXG100 family type VII secretion target n=1 Tax=Anaerosporobacter faecicola TaxID=2718714 RepID=UPI00143C8DC2|nr:WXG100 family type VII secretion target [Anaerosporobacter faecicola]
MSTENQSIKGVKTLDTSGFEAACKKFEQAGKDFTTYIKQIETTSTTLLDTWEGKGRKEFEYQYKLLKGKFEDISDDLYEIYSSLQEAEVTYVEADEEVSKAIKYSVES